MPKKLVERKAAAKCYDHLGGKLGEELFRFLLRDGWVYAMEDTEYSITEKGFLELEKFGIDASLLRKTKRKPVCACVERNESKFYPHTGAYLGTLMTERLFQLGWLEICKDGQYAVTPAGCQGLKRMGIAGKPEENC